MIKNPKNILVRGANWIGDAVLTIPALSAVRRAFPDARITLLVKPWAAELFQDHPHINGLILYDDRYRGLIGKIRLAKELKARKFDTALLLQNGFDAALLAWLAGIPERVGYRVNGRGLLLTRAAAVSDDVSEKHQLFYYLDLLTSAGIEAGASDPYIFLSDRERQWARNQVLTCFSDTQGPLIGINPGAAYGPAKRWGQEGFTDLILKIISELNGRIIIFGSPSEVEIADDIIAKINRQKIKRKIENIGSRILMMSGKTTLRELASLIAECDVFVTNDSGPMHIAAALFVPVAAVFGSTRPEATGPFGQGHRVISRNLPCSPCMKRECPEGHLRCMTEITADEVFAAVREMLPSGRGVFLDKDGTLIEDKHYLNDFKDLLLIKGVKAGLKQLGEAGFKLIGITNQSGIARGIVDEAFVRESNAYLQKELGMDDFFYCPHHPDERCACRKPEPMLLLRAKIKHAVNLRKSYVIGDRESDVGLAVKSGAAGILISSTPLFESSSAAFVAKDFSEAVQWILEREKI